MKTKIVTLVSLMLILGSCTSLYRGRTVRVGKSKETKETVKLTSAINQVSVDTLSELMPIEELELDQEIDSVKGLKIPLFSQSREQLPASVNHILENRFDSKDATIREEPASIEYVKERYKKANTMSIIGFICLLATPITAGFGVIAALVLSILAFRIYRRYENPGVKENYILSVVTLVASIVLILLAIAVLLSFAGLLVL